VWSAALNGLGKIYAMLVDDQEAFEALKVRVGSLLSLQKALFMNHECYVQ